MKIYGDSREAFTFNPVGVFNAQTRLASVGDKANLILSRAVNRSLSNVSKNIRQQTVDRYHVKPMQVGKTIRVARKASFSDPTALIRSVGRHLVLSSFKFGPRRNAYRIKRGQYSPSAFKASVEKGSSYERLIGRRKPFMQHVKNGNYISVRRVSDSIHEKKLEGVYGPAVPQMLKNQEIQDAVGHEAEIMMSKRVIHELDRLLK